MSEVYYNANDDCYSKTCDWCKADFAPDTRFFDGCCPECVAETRGEFYGQTFGGSVADSVFDIPVSEMQDLAEQYGTVTEGMASAWVKGFNSAIA